MRTRAGAGLRPGRRARPVRSVAGAACLWSAARCPGSAVRSVAEAAYLWSAAPRRGSAPPAAGRHAVAAFAPAARLAAAMRVYPAARFAMVCLMACLAPAAGRSGVVLDRAADRAAGRCGALVDLVSCLAFPADSREVAARHGAAARRAAPVAAERRAAVPGAAVPELHAVRAVARAAGRDVARCEEQVAPQAVAGVAAAARTVAAADAAPAAGVAEHHVACVLLRCAFCVARRFRADRAPGQG
jgi:hypothetical protein